MVGHCGVWGHMALEPWVRRLVARSLRAILEAFGPRGGLGGSNDGGYESTRAIPSWRPPGKGGRSARCKRRRIQGDGVRVDAESSPWPAPAGRVRAQGVVDAPCLTSARQMTRSRLIWAAPTDRSARQERRVELLVTILLAVATVATAWSSYQSARWGGVQTINFSRASAARVDSAAQSTLAGQQTQLDVATFIAWTGAYAANDTRLSDFYFKRFRAEFKPAVNAWLATKPLKNPSAPLTPFVMSRVQPRRSGQGARRSRGQRRSRRLRRRSTTNVRTTMSSPSCCSHPRCSSPVSAPSSRPSVPRHHRRAGLRDLHRHADLGRDLPSVDIGLIRPPGAGRRSRQPPAPSGGNGSAVSRTLCLRWCGCRAPG